MLKDVAVDAALCGASAAAGKATGARVKNGLNKLSNQVATGRTTATGLRQVAKYDQNMKCFNR